MRTSDVVSATTVTVRPVAELEKYASWLLGMVVAVTVFFQAHVALWDGVANINLADPFAILALAGVSVHMLFAKQFPVWKLGHFNRSLFVISALLLLGFVHGWLKIGVTQWALGGRVLGWMVLLGYLSAGYLMVANVGAHGRRRLAETLIATAAVVVVLQVILRLTALFGMTIAGHLTENFEGYAGNRNAFALQLLTAIVLLLGYSHVYARYDRRVVGMQRSTMFSLLLGVLMAGVMWTGSRAGFLVGGGMLLYAWCGRIADRAMVLRGIGFAALFWCVVWLVATYGAAQHLFIQTKFSDEDSNLERWQTLTHGWDMWRESPVFGAGLGVFYQNSSIWMGKSQVIHSTPLWILAEFGLVGGLAFGFVLLQLVRHAAWIGRYQLDRRMLALLLFMFVVFSVAHEILYQRIFWLVLGALLAQPFSLGMYGLNPKAAFRHH